jgi:DNA polymerase-4
MEGNEPAVNDRAILHLDMDAFFASVEQLDHPELRGKPILVGSASPRGVVTTASYEARPYGCHSAQPMAVARRLCPHAIIVPTRFERYREMSSRVFDILEAFSPVVQPVSIDEAFLDVSGCQRALGSPRDIAWNIKQLIATRLGISASVGVSHNKFLAKLASDMNKPDGLTIISRQDVDCVLPPLSVRKLWGVGPKTAERLEASAVRTFADVRNLSPGRLELLCGSDGGRLRNLAFGLDDRAVVPDSQAKSIGHEQTFSIDLADRAQVRAVLIAQVEHVGMRLRRHKLRAGTMTLKIRNGAFHTITRSATLAGATHVTSELLAWALGIFDGWAEAHFEPVRLIGASAGKLTSDAEQLDLFVDPSRERNRRLDGVLDQLNTRFGSSTVRRGGGKSR